MQTWLVHVVHSTWFKIGTSYLISQKVVHSGWHTVPSLPIGNEGPWAKGSERWLNAVSNHPESSRRLFGGLIGLLRRWEGPSFGVMVPLGGVMRPFRDMKDPIGGVNGPLENG